MMSDAYAAVLGALIGAIAGISGGWFSGRYQALLERDKWLRGVSDAFSNELRSSVKTLTTEIADAVHSMCWLCWLAKSGPSRLTQERIDQYDQEMHKLLPSILGSHAVIAGMDQQVHSQLAVLVGRVFRADAAIGEAGLSFLPGKPETAESLAAFHQTCVELENDLPQIVADSIRKFSVPGGPGFAGGEASGSPNLTLQPTPAAMGAIPDHPVQGAVGVAEPGRSPA